MKQQIIETSVGQALINAAVAKPGHASAITIADAWTRKQHEYKRNEWNAHLSFSTAQKLKAGGILL